MKIITTSDDMLSLSKNAIAEGQTIVTMISSGCLHEGHLALLRKG